MPANLTPDYMAAEEEYKKAKTSEEKLNALKKMLATIPKHKGTEKMQADIKRKISNLKDEIKNEKKNKSSFNVYVKKEGAGQVALVGPANSGKSLFVKVLTNADPEVADYPYTTKLPLPAMLQYKNVKIQLVDLPPINPEYLAGWLPTLIRNADAILIMIDISSYDPLKDFEMVLEFLEKYKIKLINSNNHSVNESIINMPYLILFNKYEGDTAYSNLEIIKEFYKDEYNFIPISIKNSYNLDMLGEKIFELLNVVRVYSKSPGKDPEFNSPFTVKKGSTVIDLAEKIHKDFIKNLKYARIWNQTKKGQMVQRDYILEDEDIIEFHLKD